MQKVLTAAQMREVDRLTTERYGIPSIILMENAAHAVARVIAEKLGGSVKDKSILILCGKGSNGGDGAALARILALRDADVEVIKIGSKKSSKGDARVNFDVCSNLSCGENLRISYVKSLGDLLNLISGLNIPEYSCVIDAVFGTGLTKPVDENLFVILNMFEESLRVAVDLPSGLFADSSYSDLFQFTADLTVTFTAPKVANVLPSASNHNGELFVEKIGSPQRLIDEQPSQFFLAEKKDSEDWLKKNEFSSDSYKNKRGHALLIAGSENYSGAAVLAGNAAMRSGAGLVTLAAPKDCKAEIASRLLPDVILKTIESGELLDGADAIAVGCGLDANDPDIERVVRDIVENRTVPTIVDAGALWFFNPPNGLLRYWPPANAGGSDLILTPHEGEFLRLLGTDDKEAIKDRVASVREFSQKKNVILVLKGERVLIGEPGGKVVVNPTGNSGLGKAGNGDTLTGILAGFVAQAHAMKIDIFETVIAAVYIAGMAGDVAEAKFGKRVMTASDVRECLVDVFSEFDNRRQAFSSE